MSSADGRVMVLLFFLPVIIVAAIYNGWFELIFWAIFGG